MTETNGIPRSQQLEVDAEVLRHRPIYETLINSLEVYDISKRGKFMKWYNGLLGRPDGYNNTAKFVCWDKKIFSKKLLTWNMEEGKDTGIDGKLVQGKINMDECGVKFHKNLEIEQN